MNKAKEKRKEIDKRILCFEGKFFHKQITDAGNNDSDRNKYFYPLRPNMNNVKYT